QHLQPTGRRTHTTWDHKIRPRCPLSRKGETAAGDSDRLASENRLKEKIMRRLVLAVATLELFVLPVSAQTADEIITKYVNKIGGAEQVHAIKTLRRTGKLTLGGGFEAVLVHENKRPDMVRQEMTLQG